MCVCYSRPKRLLKEEDKRKYPCVVFVARTDEGVILTEITKDIFTQARTEAAQISHKGPLPTLTSHKYRTSEGRTKIRKELNKEVHPHYHHHSR